MFIKISLLLLTLLPAVSFADMCSGSKTSGPSTCVYSKFSYGSYSSCTSECGRCGPGSGTLINAAANAESRCASFDTTAQGSKHSYSTPACSTSKSAVEAYENVCGRYMMSASDNAKVNKQQAVADAKIPTGDCTTTGDSPQRGTYDDKGNCVANYLAPVVASAPLISSPLKEGPCEKDGVKGSYVGGSCVTITPTTLVNGAKDVAGKDLNAQNANQAPGVDPSKVKTDDSTASAVTPINDGSTTFEQAHKQADADLQANITSNQNKVNLTDEKTIKDAKETQNDYSDLRSKVISGDVKVSKDGDSYSYTDAQGNALSDDKVNKLTNGLGSSGDPGGDLKNSLATLTTDRDNAKKDGATSADKKTYADQKDATNTLKDGTDKTVSDAKGAQKNDRAEVKKDQAEKSVDSGKAKAIMETGTAEGSDAHYGHHSVGSTETNLQTTAMAQSMISTVGSGMVSMSGNRAQSALVAKGATATQTDYVNAQKSAAGASITANTTAAGLSAAAAYMQYKWSGNHRKDSNDTVAIAGRAKTDLGTMNADQKATGVQSYDSVYQSEYGKVVAGALTASYANCGRDADKAAITARATNSAPTITERDCAQLQNFKAGKNAVAAVSDLRKNSLLSKYVEPAHQRANEEANAAAQGVVGQTITTNSTTEQKAQTAMAEKAASSAIQSAVGAAQAITNVIATKNAMDNLSASTAGGGFSFNPGTGDGYGDGGLAGAPTPVAGAIVDSQQGDNALKNTDQFNPGTDNGIGGPGAAGAFQPGLASAPPAGGAGGGGLSTGGTSAAKDDGSNKDNTPPGKSSVGSYSPGDNTAAGSYTRNSGGGGSGVGMDNSFADLLKKFLPGGDEEKKQGDAMAFDQDRNPASDAAAVLGRNKNIFEEIHKRYEKKSTEGAIVF